MVDIEKLKVLAEAATDGPWKSGGNWVSTARGVSIADCARGDQHFIAAANPAAVLELIAEVSRWKALSANQADRTDAAVEIGKELRKERDQFKAENEALRKSATRYEWLRDEHTRPGCLSSDPDKAKWLDEYLMCGEKLDAAIDEQLAK